MAEKKQSQKCVSKPMPLSFKIGIQKILDEKQDTFIIDYQSQVCADAEILMTFVLLWFCAL